MGTVEQAHDRTPSVAELDLAQELVRLREIESAAREFCERCERGEIRSSRTYRRFRAALVRRADAGA